MRAVLRSLLPHPCPGCGRPLSGRAGLCPSCDATLHLTVVAHTVLRPDVTPHLICLGEYRGPLRRAIREMKYGGAREVAEVFGRALGRGVPEGWQIGAVTPVPLHPRREQERTFNQAGAVAHALAEEADLPLRELLTRSRFTSAQAKLHAGARVHNLDGAFEPRAPCSGQVLLVDDVLTTGETLRACTAALRAGGARAVYYAVIAR